MSVGLGEPGAAAAQGLVDTSELLLKTDHRSRKCRIISPTSTLNQLHIPPILNDSRLFDGYRANTDTANSLQVSNLKTKEDAILLENDKLSSITDACTLLQKCTLKKDYVNGKHVYLQLIDSGLDAEPVVIDSLIQFFGACGRLQEADHVFSRFSHHGLDLWRSIITVHARNDDNKRVMEIYSRMVQESAIPDSYACVYALKSCINMGALKQGCIIHANILEAGLESDLYVASSLVNFYIKCGEFQTACIVFSMIPYKNVVTWSAMIAGCAEKGYIDLVFWLFEEMQFEGVYPNDVTYSEILNACGVVGALSQGMQLHNQIISDGLDESLIIRNTLIDMYSKCGSLQEAHAVFDEMDCRDIVSWNTLIAAYTDNEDGFSALCVFEAMDKSGFRPNKITLSSVLKACASVHKIEEGKLIHDQILKVGLETDDFIHSSLIDMYCKNGCLGDAEMVFNSHACQNIVPWGAIMAGYANNNLGLPVMDLFVRMQDLGMKPNKFVYSSVLKACSCTRDLSQGIYIHEQICRSGIGICAFIGSSLIDMYTKCGHLEAARSIFENLRQKDIVSWGAMISGYAQQGHPMDALQLYQKMQRDGINPDKAVCVCLLEACGNIGAIKHGQNLHSDVIENGLYLDTDVGNAVLHMYVKCEDIDYAQIAFNSLQSRDVKSWNMIIISSVQHGKCWLARQCLLNMETENLLPDDILFTSILSTCCRTGQIKEGQEFFLLMSERYHIKPSIEHYGCMVDLLGKEGRLLEAEDLIECLPFTPDCTAWVSLLSACRAHKNVEIGKMCFNKLMELDSETGTGHVLMSHIYADAAMWEEANLINNQRKRSDMWKVPGRAWIEVNKEVHEFVVGDKTHPQSDRIYAHLRRLAGNLKNEGYVPQFNDLSDGNEAEHDLFAHCEKLAIAFGLLNTPEGATIRVVKNLRVCSDCHNASKFLSKVERREIVIVDSFCTHHFNNGICSCEVCNP